MRTSTRVPLCGNLASTSYMSAFQPMSSFPCLDKEQNFALTVCGGGGLQPWGWNYRVTAMPGQIYRQGEGGAVPTRASEELFKKLATEKTSYHLAGFGQWATTWELGVEFWDWNEMIILF